MARVLPPGAACPCGKSFRYDPNEPTVFTLTNGLHLCAACWEAGLNSVPAVDPHCPLGDQLLDRSDTPSVAFSMYVHEEGRPKDALCRDCGLAGIHFPPPASHVLVAPTGGRVSLCSHHAHMRNASGSLVPLRPFSRPGTVCFDHLAAMDAFCASCSLMLCYNCVLEEGHSDHDVVTCAEGIQALKGPLEAAVAEAEAAAVAARAQAARIAHALTHDPTHIRTAMAAQRAMLKACVEAQAAALCAEIDRIVTQKLLLLDQQHECNLRRLHALDGVIDMVRALTKADTGAIARALPWLTQYTQALRRTDRLAPIAPVATPTLAFEEALGPVMQAVNDWACRRK